MGVLSPAGSRPGRIFQHPDGEPASIHRGGGQQWRRDDLDLLCHMSGTSGRLEPSHRSEGADLEEFNEQPVRSDVEQTRDPLL